MPEIKRRQPGAYATSPFQMIQPGAEGYPERLQHIDAPPDLWVKGELPAQMRGVTCVGTRKPTRWGRVVTERIVRRLVEEGYSIVSGLALGIDALAHEAALDAGGHTVAVLPCSIDQLYPKCHRDLAERILASGGALVSLFAPGSKMNRGSFIRRNRIQSGLSVGTVVMQCAKDSGTLHTARFAQEQGRLLCAAKPQGRYALETQSQGNLELLEQPGSLVLRSREDYPELLGRLRELSISA
ncbi:MAG: DNA-processing protein DprA [Bacteroidota bacterium]